VHRILWLGISLGFLLLAQQSDDLPRSIAVSHASNGVPLGITERGAAAGSLVIVSQVTFEAEAPPFQGIRLTRGRSEWVLPIVRQVSRRAWVVLPPDVTPGPASIRAIIKNKPTLPAVIQVVESHFELFVQTQRGARPLTSSSLTRPSRPGATVSIYGTGLGNAARERVSVILAGRREIVPQYVGPSPGTPGLDQINFTIPEDAPENCYVGIEVRTGERVSQMGEP
jgi:hypothetical protein